MSYQSWLRKLRSALAPRRGRHHHTRRGSLRAATHRPSLELLEDRVTPTLQLAGYYPGADLGHPPTPLFADVTSDGIPDLIDRNGNLDAIVVQPGRGDGTFGDPISTYAPTGGFFVAADFNGDGRLDLFTVIPPNVWGDDGREYWAVYLGRGDGTFVFADLPLQAFDTWFTTQELVGVWDINGDGRPDAAVAGYDSYSQEYTAVLLNDGNWVAVPPGPRASSFTISGFPSPTLAGQAGSFTVAALDQSGNVLTDYVDRVDFYSSDPRAILPAEYTFTAADQGMHTFSATLKAAGSQSLSAYAGYATGTQTGITVNPGAVSGFAVGGFPSPVTAGVAGGFTVTALDSYGNRATGYTGTVHFSSSDSKATLPGNYTFTAADAGMHTFSATLKTAGTQALTATDTANAALTGGQPSIRVNPAAASRLVLSAPSSVKANTAFSLTVTVVDAYGNVVIGYRGTLTFSSTDPTANLPKNYTFTAADQGVHTFTGLRLKKKGQQTPTVADTLNSLLLASASIDVL